MSSLSRILILTSSHLCRNPRVVKEATTLGAAGYDVTVLTVTASKRFEQLDLELLRGLPFRREILNCTSNRGAAQLAQRASTWLARKLRQHFGVETAQALGPASALLRRARSLIADLTIAHCEIPLWASRQLIEDGRRVAVDFEDWYSEDLLPTDRNSRPLELLRCSEVFALHHCAYASCTSQSMANALVDAYHCPPPVVLRNSFPLQLHSRADTLPNDRPPRFIWFSQTIGPGRGLEQFFAAWALTKRRSEVFLLGDERPGYREELLANLPATRCSDVHFLPLVTPAALPGVLAEFDLGLALESQSPLNRNITITNKILQYMNAGLAIIASDTDGQREVMSAAPNCGTLVRSDQPAEFAAKLDEFTGDRARLRAAQLASRSAAENEFCWEKESSRLLEAVAHALAVPPPSADPCAAS